VFSPTESCDFTRILLSRDVGYDAANHNISKSNDYFILASLAPSLLYSPLKDDFRSKQSDFNKEERVMNSIL
jgi:hypothetical protein